MKNSDQPPVSIVAADASVLSPCRRQCCLDDTDRCIGCGRLLAEILEWGSASGVRQREICTLAKTRLRPLPFGGR